MIKTLLTHPGFRWMAGGLLLGAVLGICFFTLLRPGGTGGLGGSKPESGLIEGLALAGQLTAEGKTAEARSTLEKLVERYPDSPEAYNNLAALQAAQGELEASRDQLEKALRTNESYAAIYENLGVVYSEIARSSYGKALRLDLPPSSPQLKVLSHLGPPATTARPIAPSPAPAPAAQVKSAAAPAAKPAPAPAAATPPAAPPKEPAAPQVSQRELLRTLHGWAKAWSEKDVPRYVSYYSGKFRPEGGQNRDAWEEQRKQRIGNPAWIKVELHNIILSPTGPDRVEVKLIQDYRADTFRDRTRKAMTLVREGDSWRILAENTLGRAR